MVVCMDLIFVSWFINVCLVMVMLAVNFMVVMVVSRVECFMVRLKVVCW